MLFFNCNWFKKKISYEDPNENIVELERADEGPEFKSFHKTYKIISFAMVVGLIYPNKKTEMCRVINMITSLASVTPIALIVFIDAYKCWVRRDFIEIIRHCTVFGPFLGGFVKDCKKPLDASGSESRALNYQFPKTGAVGFTCHGLASERDKAIGLDKKMFLMYYKRVECKQLIDEIDSDYERYNQRCDAHKRIIRASLQNNLKYSEMGWAYTVVGTVMTFPFMATVLNLYNFTSKMEPKKYMIHELNIPGSKEPEARHDSPYFELMYVYMLYCSMFYVINFLGYDGFFGLMINHACLKMTLYCQAVEDAMRVREKADMYHRMVKAIQEQNRMFGFVEVIQETFNIWLGIILIATMIQICNCMYHIMEGAGFDLKYAIFIIGTTIHIYLPCRYASKLKTMSVETADSFYSSGWENVHDQTIRKMLAFMIARGQKPIEITAFNMLTFDMELFVSILQTSYSMFTLLRS